jgi:hypothetical protein
MKQNLFEGGGIRHRLNGRDLCRGQENTPVLKAGLRRGMIKGLMIAYASVWAVMANAGVVANIGDGLDGNFSVPTNQTVMWGTATYAPSTPLTMPTQTNQAQITVGNTAGFKSGDEVLLYVDRADDATGAAGHYETFHIASVQSSGLLTLDHAPSVIYNPSQEVVTMQRVPNFNNVTISTNGTLVASPWNGTGGGIIFFRAQGTLNVAGTISASGAGFLDNTSWSLDGAGGKGGNNGGGAGGQLDADTTFQHLFLGTGGEDGTGSPLSGPGIGGFGGGLIYAAAYAIVMTGSINVSGGNGGSVPRGYYATGGGGGSGGEVWLQCWDASGMTSTNIYRSGGIEGSGDDEPGESNGQVGLFRLDFNIGPGSYAGAEQFMPVDNVVSTAAAKPSVVFSGFSPTLTITGSVGYLYFIQRSANIADTNAWVTVTNLTLTQPVQIWADMGIDASSPFNSKYFYRAYLPGP